MNVLLYTRGEFMKNYSDYYYDDVVTTSNPGSLLLNDFIEEYITDKKNIWIVYETEYPQQFDYSEILIKELDERLLFQARNNNLNKCSNLLKIFAITTPIVFVAATTIYVTNSNLFTSILKNLLMCVSLGVSSGYMVGKYLKYKSQKKKAEFYLENKEVFEKCYYELDKEAMKKEDSKLANDEVNIYVDDISLNNLELYSLKELKQELKNFLEIIEEEKNKETMKVKQKIEK